MTDEGVRWEGLNEFVQALVDAALTVRRVVLIELRSFGNYTAYLCRLELADVRYTGALEQSFIVEVDEANLKASIYPTAAHRMFVRMGTRPHWAPIGPLKRWAAVKLGDERAAYPVQRSIAQHGTSMYQLSKRGTKENPWPRRVVERSEFQTALEQFKNQIGATIVEAIAE